MTSENRNKAYIRYEDPATKNKIVLELCCVEIERLPSTVEEFDARECELDCCEQQFFGTFKTSVNQQTGEFPKKSQPSVPDKPSTTPSQPTENTGTNNGNVTPSNPSENNGNTGNTDTGTSTQPSENGGTATQPDAPTVYNTIKLVPTDDLDEVLMEFNVKGKVGEQVRLGDIISKLSFENRNYFDITEDGKLMKEGVSFTLPDGHSSVLDYIYTICLLYTSDAADE